MISDDFDLLETMLADQKNQLGIHTPGPYWRTYADRVADACRFHGLASFRGNSPIVKGFGDDREVDPLVLLPDTPKFRVYKWIARKKIVKKYFLKPFQLHIQSLNDEARNYKNLYYDLLLKDWLIELETTKGLPETLVNDPTSTIKIADRELGAAYLAAMLRIDNFSHYAYLSKKKVAMEIGGGFGAMCHSLLHFYPNLRKYIYVDIPPVLYVGTQYLKQFYGDAVLSYLDTKDKVELIFKNDDSLEIFAIAPWQVQKLASKIDWFWNSASFQEMTAEVVTNYMAHVSRLFKNQDARAGFAIYRGGGVRQNCSNRGTAKTYNLGRKY